MSKNCLNCGAPRELDIRAKCSYCGTPPAISLIQSGSTFTVAIRDNIKNNLQGNTENEAEDDLSLAILYLLNNLPVLALPIVDNVLLKYPTNGRALVIKSVCFLKEKGIKRSNDKKVDEVTSMLNMAVALDEGSTRQEVHFLMQKIQTSYYTYNHIRPSKMFKELYENLGTLSENEGTILDEILD
jgi:hypothetical protein